MWVGGAGGGRIPREGGHGWSDGPGSACTKEAPWVSSEVLGLHSQGLWDKEAPGESRSSVLANGPRDPLGGGNGIWRHKQHLSIVAAPQTWPLVWPPGSQSPPLLEAARAPNQTHPPKAQISMADPLLITLCVSRNPLKRTTPKSCGPAPTCFLNLTLFPLAYLSLLCTSHLLSLPACVPPSEVFLFCPLADHRQPCSRIQAPEGPTFCRYLWLRFACLDLITLSRL